MSFIIFAGGCFTLLVSLGGAFLIFRCLGYFPQKVSLTINSCKKLTVSRKGSLLGALVKAGFLVPSSCGGEGKCGQCRCQVTKGGGAPGSRERHWLSEGDLQSGMRLSCRVSVRRNLLITLTEQVLNAEKFVCTVGSNLSLTPFIKELTLQLPQKPPFHFQPGCYLMLSIPAHSLSYAQIEVAPKFLGHWQGFEMERYRSRVPYALTCAYSIASSTVKNGQIQINVRVLHPEPAPPHEQEAVKATPCLISQPSAWLFTRRVGDEVTIYGPYGSFFLQQPESECIFIGGGTGLAPLISHIRTLFQGEGYEDPVSLWYGCTTGLDAIYLEELEGLASSHANFKFHLVLSRPLAQDNWEGPVGHVQDFLRDSYLVKHPAPEVPAYYICGPSIMAARTYGMLLDFGVPDDNIHLDEQAIPRHLLATADVDGITGATVLSIS